MAGLKCTLALFLTCFVLGGNAVRRFSSGNSSTWKRNLHKLVIVPGTLWCGPGDFAKNDNDLGTYKQTDACCREHDLCPQDIPPGGHLGNLTNNGLYTLSSCECDWKFYLCLGRVGPSETATARTVGRMYFDWLRPQCFIDYKQIVKCLEYGRPKFGKRTKCVSYEYDDKENETLQWIDNPDWIPEGENASAAAIETRFRKLFIPSKN